MDATRFDEIVQMAAGPDSRRGLLRLATVALGGCLATFLAGEGEAAKRRQRTRRRRSEQRARVHDERKKKTKRKGSCARAGQAPQKGRGCCAGLVRNGAGQCAQPAPPTCAQSCAGCCTGETCVTATSAAACGANGIPCGVCSGLRGTCFGGACRCDVCADGCRYPTVQDAVADVDGPSTITICAGSYGGDVTIGRDVTLLGAGDGDDPAGNTILQGTGGGSAVTVPAGVTATLQGLRISGGSADEGGGIRNDGTLTLTDCTITANNANNGGGIASAGTLTLTDCEVSHNTANVGGGFHIDGGTLTIESSIVIRNTSIFGGGIQNIADVTATNTTFTRNRASASGGGIDNAAGTFALNECEVSRNLSSSGGGLWVSGGIVTLDGSDVVLNQADAGGGIVEAAGEVALTGSVVSGNSPDNCAPAAAIPGCSG
jgi:hypothetical protein